MFVTSASGQRAVVIGRGVRKRAIAVKVVSKRLDAGGGVKRASVIGRPTRAWSGGGTKVGGIGNANANG